MKVVAIHLTNPKDYIGPVFQTGTGEVHLTYTIKNPIPRTTPLYLQRGSNDIGFDKIITEEKALILFHHLLRDTNKWTRWIHVGFRNGIHFERIDS